MMFLVSYIKLFIIKYFRILVKHIDLIITYSPGFIYSCHLNRLHRQVNHHGICHFVVMVL